MSVRTSYDYKKTTTVTCHQSMMLMLFLLLVFDAFHTHTPTHPQQLSSASVTRRLKKDGCGTGAAYTDINGDGVLDVLISHGESSEQPLTVYSAKKDKTRNNNWFRVKVLTRYGALVALTTNVGIRLTQVINGGSGYLCQMEPVAHFGLGQYAARSIIVTWTDGEKLTKVLDSEKDANQLIIIKHPDTTSSFNSWSAERNGEKINITVRTTIREEL